MAISSYKIILAIVVASYFLMSNLDNRIVVKIIRLVIPDYIKLMDTLIIN